MQKQTIEVVSYPILVGNQEYEVREADPLGWNQGSMGCVNIIESKILINENMNDTQKASTLMHEIIHIIADQNSLECACSEQEVTILANGVYDFIVNNPAVILDMLSLYHDFNEFGLTNVDEVWDDDEEDALNGAVPMGFDTKTCTA